jgi:plastocyanin
MRKPIALTLALALAGVLAGLCFRPLLAPARAAGGWQATVTIQAGGHVQPSKLSIAEDAWVTWVNQDSVDHTLIGDGWGSGPIKPGQSWQHRFVTAGLYPYNCPPPADLHGTIEVIPGG